MESGSLCHSFVNRRILCASLIPAEPDVVVKSGVLCGSETTSEVGWIYRCCVYAGVVMVKWHVFYLLK